MAGVGDIWDVTRWPPGWDVRYVERTGSTNEDLLAAAAAGGAADRTVLAAGHQTAGRGRMDRRWEAPPGANLLVSLLFDPVPALPSELTQRVALAAATAAERVAGLAGIGLKWPNDLVLDGRKLAGILAQRAARVAVVGLGFNVGWSPPGAADLGGRVAPADLLAAILREFDALPVAIGAPYRERLVTLGMEVRAELPGGNEVVGVAHGVDDDGRLLVLDAVGGRHVLDVGDVVHLRPAHG